MLPEPEFLPSRQQRGQKAWKSEYVRQVFYLALMGATEAQIAQAFDVSQSTISKWKEVYPEFAQSMNAGKMDADAKVAHSLYLAAVGYSHPEEVIVPNRIREFDEKGRPTKEYTEIIRVKTTRNYAPNAYAGFKWLNARQPDVWGSKLHVKGEISHTHKLDLSHYTIEELELLNKISLQNKPKEIEDTSYEDV
jgi:hypothetical protein